MIKLFAKFVIHMICFSFRIFIMIYSHSSFHIGTHCKKNRHRSHTLFCCVSLSYSFHCQRNIVIAKFQDLTSSVYCCVYLKHILWHNILKDMNVNCKLLYVVLNCLEWFLTFFFSILLRRVQNMLESIWSKLPKSGTN